MEDTKMSDERAINQNSTITWKFRKTKDRNQLKHSSWRERFAEVMQRKQFQESAIEIAAKMKRIGTLEENKTIEIDAISVEDLSHVSPVDAAILATRNNSHINKLKMLRE